MYCFIVSASKRPNPKDKTNIVRFNQKKKKKKKKKIKKKKKKKKKKKNDASKTGGRGSFVSDLLVLSLGDGERYNSSIDQVKTNYY